MESVFLQSPSHMDMEQGPLSLHRGGVEGWRSGGAVEDGMLIRSQFGLEDCVNCVDCVEVGTHFPGIQPHMTAAVWRRN